MLRPLLILGLVASSVSQLGPVAPPACESQGSFGSVLNFTDSDGNARCLSLIVPPAPEALPVLFYFHGSGGNAKFCGAQKGEDDGKSLVDLAVQYGFALACGEALQFAPQGGQWVGLGLQHARAHTHKST